jgi:hypothetical protein
VSCGSYEQAVQDRSSALTLATASDVAFVAGGVAVVTSAILFFTAPSAQTSPARPAAVTAPSLLPELGPHTGGFVLRGRF